ncbi:hypothetical protein [Parafrankia sp. CH37]|uniref:hypothetical protein n=1 Tax=Parafrankia sp. CH37 TaxID=683308 RepID=UPI001866760C|nr:hypothetical protein [Parafrankia sp. CH37]MBE3206599.1 hypothetical protein [Parafrankia sp. CH37]
MAARDVPRAQRERRLLEAVEELSAACDDLVRLATALHAIGDAGRLVSSGGRSSNRHVIGASVTTEEVDQVAGRAEARALVHLVALARLEVRMLGEAGGGPVTGYGDFTAIYAQGTSLEALRDLVRRPRAATRAAQAYVDDVMTSSRRCCVG